MEDLLEKREKITRLNEENSLLAARVEKSLSEAKGRFLSQRKSQLSAKVSRLRAETAACAEEIEKDKLWLKILADTAKGEERERESLRGVWLRRTQCPDTLHLSQRCESLSAELDALQREKVESLLSLFLAHPRGISGTLSLPGSESEIGAFAAAPLESPLCQLMLFLRLAVRYTGIELPFDFFPRGLASCVKTWEPAAGEIPLFSLSPSDSQLRVNFWSYSALVSAAEQLALKLGWTQEKERPFMFLWKVGNR